MSRGLGFGGMTRFGDPLASRTDASGKFTKAAATLQASRTLSDRLTLRAIAMGQYSNRPLLSAEEFSLAATALAVPTASTRSTGDRGAGAGLELGYRLGKGDASQSGTELFGFVDGGVAVDLKSAIAPRQRRSLGSAGVGARFSIAGITAAVEAGAPLKGDHHSPRLFASVFRCFLTYFDLFSAALSVVTLALTLTSVLPTLFSNLVAGFLNVIGDVRADVLRRVTDVRSRIFGNVAVVGDAGRPVRVVLADLAGAEQQKRDGECNAHDFLRCFEALTPLSPFRLRFNPAGKRGEHRRPRGDVLTKLRRVDLVERVVGRVVPVEIAGSVLVERNPRRAGLDRRLDVGTVRIALVVLGDTERSECGGSCA